MSPDPLNTIFEIQPYQESLTNLTAKEALTYALRLFFYCKQQITYMINFLRPVLAYSPHSREGTSQQELSSPL